MPTLVQTPSIVKAAGNKPKIIEEFIGRVNSGDEQISIARMQSPEGWEEPGQTPEFDEYTFVLKGQIHVEYKDGSFDVHEGEIMVANKGEWVKYSTPEPGGAEYIAICTPAFSSKIVHRDL